MITEIEFIDDQTPDDRYRFRRDPVNAFSWSLELRRGGHDEWHIIRDLGDIDPFTGMQVLWNMAHGIIGPEDDDSQEEVPQ